MWIELYQRHQENRQVGRARVDIEFRQRIKELVRRKHCEYRFLGKVEYKRNPSSGIQEVWVKGQGSAMGEPIPLSSLPDLTDAYLSLAAALDYKKTVVQRFTISLQGKAAGDGRPLLISAEIDASPLGSGACGHALIHCHVGPDHTSKPEVRVPMPAITPWDAMDWVLSQVVPDWEPAPWPDVLQEIEKMEGAHR
jgi:hypothetical protein